jgi:hypothetical protein
LHRESDNYSGENGLPARDLVGKLALIDVSVGIKRKNLLFRTKLVLGFERILETYHVERKLGV